MALTNPTRLIAVGDIHGEHDKLSSLLQKLSPSDSDQVVFLGDYIDRGADSSAVIALLIGFAERFPHTVFLRGNHEQMLLDALASDGHLPDWMRLADIDPEYARDIHPFSDLQILLSNGGMATLSSYGYLSAEFGRHPLVWPQIPKAHLVFLTRTRLWHRQEGFLFVHAAAHNDRPLEEQSPYTLLWERYLPPGRDEMHVVGHTPTPNGQPFFEQGRISLDTGVAYGRKLSACDVLSGRIWQA